MVAKHLRGSITSLTVLSVALLFTSLLQPQAAGASSNLGRSGEQKRQPEYVPVRSVVYRSLALPAAVTTTTTEAVGGYEPFEVCEGCRCCSTSNASSCVDTSCCYSIDCNLPGKPYGTCAFTPQTCGCGSTSNCTQPS